MDNKIKEIRNIAIIAHVDHGKTTLVDSMLKQSSSIAAHESLPERAMDNNELEKERGITILAKNTSIIWKDTRINIIDTPGHADFGGEVERILSMVDAALLLVDSVEGPMPQTRFVAKKALEKNLKLMVAINKIDRPQAQPDIVIDSVFDLLVSLNASDDQLDFTPIYVSGMNGVAGHEPDALADDLEPLFKYIVEQAPEPKCEPNAPFKMQVTSLDYSSYTGAIAIGKVSQGSVKVGEKIYAIKGDGTVKSGKVIDILMQQALHKYQIPEAKAGDITMISGISDISISDTISTMSDATPYEILSVDAPTVSVIMSSNNSPFAGLEGKFVTSRQIKARLDRELITNVALKVETMEHQDSFKISGRGELHLSILIEQMRREGFEMTISKPNVIFKEKNDEILEPFENVSIDISIDHQGTIMEIMGKKQAKLINMQPESERVLLEYYMPSRGLIGFSGEFKTLTNGTGILNHIFAEYNTKLGDEIESFRNGVMIANENGQSTGFALWNLQARGKLLIGPQTKVYEGMVVGIHSRQNDLVVNVTKAKQLTNVRASGTDENIVLTPHTAFSLEQALDFINNDELLEVTPDNIRIRKKYLKESERKRRKLL